jgi:hypothetical protein
LKNTSPESEPVIDVSQLFKNPQSFNFPTQKSNFLLEASHYDLPSQASAQEASHSIPLREVQPSALKLSISKS